MAAKKTMKKTGTRTKARTKAMAKVKEDEFASALSYITERIRAARIHTAQARDNIGLISYGDGANNAVAVADALQDLCSAVEILIYARTL